MAVSVGQKTSLLSEYSIVLCNRNKIFLVMVTSGLKGHVLYIYFLHNVVFIKKYLHKVDISFVLAFYRGWFSYEGFCCWGPDCIQIVDRLCTHCLELQVCSVIQPQMMLYKVCASEGRNPPKHQEDNMSMHSPPSLPWVVLLTTVSITAKSSDWKMAWGHGLTLSPFIENL